MFSENARIFEVFLSLWTLMFEFLWCALTLHSNFTVDYPDINNLAVAALNASFRECRMQRIVIKNVHVLSRRMSACSLFVDDDGYISMKLLHKLLPKLQSVIMSDLALEHMCAHVSEYIECIEEVNDLLYFEFRSEPGILGILDISILSNVYESMARLCAMGRTIEYLLDDNHCHRIVSERKYGNAAKWFTKKQEAAQLMQSFSRSVFERMKYLKFRSDLKQMTKKIQSLLQNGVVHWHNWEELSIANFCDVINGRYISWSVFDLTMLQTNSHCKKMSKIQ